VKSSVVSRGSTLLTIRGATVAKSPLRSLTHTWPEAATADYLLLCQPERNIVVVGHSLGQVTSIMVFTPQGQRVLGDGLLLPNPIREGLPTNRPESSHPCQPARRSIMTRNAWGSLLGLNSVRTKFYPRSARAGWARSTVPATGFDDYGRRVFEGDAAIVVIGIAQRGEISRLRACEQCGSWFFASANTSHNARKFCKDACRLKHFHHRR
jgi:hypothetical protein